MNELTVFLLFANGGFLRAIQDIFWFHKTENVFFKLFENSILWKFYDGHYSVLECLWKEKCPKVLKYNPSIFFTCDFWHAVKKIEYVSYTIALLFAMTTPSFWYLLSYFVWGLSFVINYEYLLRFPRLSIIKVIKKLFHLGDRKEI